MIEDLKHIFSVLEKTCDQGYNIRFNSINCEIREADPGILVATTIRNSLNIYTLDKVKRKKIEALQKRNENNNKEGELVLRTI